MDEDLLIYLEDKIKSNLAKDDEEQMYIDYVWNESIDKNTYKHVIRRLRKEMNRIYFEGN